ncbi:MAG: stage III sporulation protein AF [Syntrophomonadaceae bacterium]|nr:stage III sporulation protein AF [Syntrophomonadaceae bacterium]
MTEIVKTVLVIIIVASLLELLLPDSGLKPFVSFTMGLFVLIAILNPVLNFAFKDREFAINLWDYKYDQALEEEMLDKGMDINQQVIQSNDQQIQEKLQGQISAMTSLVPGVQEVDAQIKKGEAGAADKFMLLVRVGKNETDDDSKDVEVFGSGAEKKLRREEQERIKEKILLLIDNMYGIKAGQIEIKFEGGDS